jgi:peptidoglycan/xylan/chitin deacetylase (PgdA/CDA1 family)
MSRFRKVIVFACSLAIAVMIFANVPLNASAAPKLSTKSVKMTANNTYQINIIGKEKNATYTFKSSNTKVATVSSTGLIRALKEGTATITVNSTKGKKTTKVGTLTVTITKAPTPTPSPTPAPTPTPAPAEKPPLKKDGTIDYEKAKLVALTFDDGPNNKTTVEVLDKLEEYGVVATFFLIGQNITKDIKPVMERQLELGCELASHSWSHKYMNAMKPAEIKKEISDTNNKIKEMVGVTPKFFRPPYIAVSTTMYDNISLPFICGIMANDWTANVSAQDRYNGILKQVQDGSIILLHDFYGNDNTVEALDLLIPELQRQGYVFVTLSQLFEYKGVDPMVKNFIWTTVNKAKQ